MSAELYTMRVIRPWGGPPLDAEIRVGRHRRQVLERGKFAELVTPGAVPGDPPALEGDEGAATTAGLEGLGALEAGTRQGRQGRRRSGRGTLATR